MSPIFRISEGYAKNLWTMYNKSNDNIGPVIGVFFIPYKRKEGGNYE